MESRWSEGSYNFYSLGLSDTYALADSATIGSDNVLWHIR